MQKNTMPEITAIRCRYILAKHFFVNNSLVSCTNSVVSRDPRIPPFRKAAVFEVGRPPKAGAERGKSYAFASANPSERTRKRATKERRMKADNSLGVLVLLQRVEVARVLVNLNLCCTICDAGVFVKIKARKN